MAILDEIKRITATRRDLRKFGLTFAIVLVLLSAYSVWKHVSAYNYLVPIAAALAVTGWRVPFVLKPFYLFWRTITIVIGFIITNIFLALLFYVVITPMGLIFRIAGRKTVPLGWEETTATYWNRRDPRSSEQNHLKQF